MHLFTKKECRYIVIFTNIIHVLHLNKKQKKAIDLLSNILNQHFSQIKRQSYVDKINEFEIVLNEKEEEYLKIIKAKNETIETQYQKIEYLYKDIESKNKGLTIQQQNIFYYYLFNELGVNFGNSTKTHWAKLISNVNGRNEVNIRKALSIKFDDSTTKKDMIVVAKLVKLLFPSIAQKILNDCD